MSAGDTFQLFSAPGAAGGFSSLVLPALTPGLYWNTNAFKATATITVAAETPPNINSISASAGKLALAQYQQARDAWASMAERANRVYQADITYGDIPMRRGNWSARLAAIDKDLSSMRHQVERDGLTLAAVGPTVDIERSIRAATGTPIRPSIPCVHTPPASFRPGQPLALSLSASGRVDTVRLYYRHVNQGERWVSMAMQPVHDGYGGAIPGDYTNSAFALQYYFVLQRGTDTAWFFPAFNATLSNQPYYAIAKRS